MNDTSRLAAIRLRDSQSADTWFRTTPKEPDGVGACGRAFIDRRWLLAEVDRLTKMPPDPQCQHDLLKPNTTIEVIDKWKAKCNVCIEFFDLPGQPERSGPFFGDEP